MFLKSVLSLLAVGLHLFPPPTNPQGSPVCEASAVRQIFLHVGDKDGQPVQNLRPEDLSLTLN